MKIDSVLARATMAVSLLAAIPVNAAPVHSGTKLPVNGEYICVERGPHSKIWQRATTETNRSGITRTNVHSYTELATGLCYLENGQYVDSVEEIDPVADGAQAIQGRHQAHWMANANTPGGAVTVTTPDNKTLTSTVYGLAYYDTASGSNVLLAQLQDSFGVITSSNTFTYTNAFSNLVADIRYTYKKSGLSQDIVLQQQPPSPAEYGLAPATTRLEVLTEFFNPPPPRMSSITNNGLPDDCQLNFGDMKMGVGHAFLFQSDGTTQGGGSVIKEWTKYDNRTFLIEEVPFTAVSNLLSSLHSSLIKPDKSRVRRTVQLDSPKPRKISAQPVLRPARIVKKASQEKALVVDYDLVSSTNDFTFQGDTTYLVSGLCNFGGTVTLEGGTVIKYTNNASAQIQATNFVCLTAPYRPAVFTSMNDNSAGDTISGSTGNPWGNNAGKAALYCYGAGDFSGGNAELQNVRFSHLAACVSLQDQIDDAGGSLTMSDFQIVDCQQVVESVDAECSLFNGLVYNVSNLFGSYDGKTDNAGESLTAVNLTVHHCSRYAVDQTSMMFFTNCLFAEVTNIYTLPIYTFIASSYFLSNDTGVFQTVGAASHYLADNSTNRGAGTTNIGASFLADLAMKTTYPPVNVPPGIFTNDYTFFPQAQRDNVGSMMDLGYHYDPLDYLISILVSNASVKVLPGTALGSTGQERYGISLYTNASASFKGTATSPDYFVRYNTVQEQSNPTWAATVGFDMLASIAYGSPPVSLNLRSTVISSLGATDFALDMENTNLTPFTFQDCEFYGGQIFAPGPTALMTNCFFRRVVSYFADGNGPNDISFYNDLFLGGELEYCHGDAGTWTIRDSLFDQALAVQDCNAIDIGSNNAFVTTNYGFVMPTNGAVFLTNSPEYQRGFLGEYYYPDTQTTLIHQGSRFAPDAGLYHYTVTTNNTIEGTNIVSIGFHYVATDTNGVPLDASGDGIPDYIADLNGNGLVDSGEIAWNTNDLGLVVIITQPANNSNIP